MKAKFKAGKGQPSGPRYVTVYRHYLTGKIMKASDYGHKAWPFGKRKG